MPRTRLVALAALALVTALAGCRHCSSCSSQAANSTTHEPAAVRPAAFTMAETPPPKPAGTC